MENLYRLTFISPDADTTHRIGRLLGGCLRGGEVVALEGELGAGKTQFTKGIAEGLGVEDKYEITSPTYTLLNEYRGRISLYHLDAYRLGGTDDLQEIGYDEYLEVGGVLVIEWSDRIREAVPENSIFVSLVYLDESTREIKLQSSYEFLRKILSKVEEEERVNGFSGAQIRWDLGR